MPRSAQSGGWAHMHTHSHTHTPAPRQVGSRSLMLVGMRVMCATVMSPGLGSSVGQPGTDSLCRHRGGSRPSQVPLLAGEAGWEFACRGGDSCAHCRAPAALLALLPAQGDVRGDWEPLPETPSPGVVSLDWGLRISSNSRLTQPDLSRAP